MTILALKLHCVLFEHVLPCNNKSCLLCSSSMCLFRQNGINEQKGQNSKINKLAGENKSEQRGQNFENQ